uniref:WD repeat-containing protein 55 homolog n=1 Tax=Dendroctonus ponderosae TaxID=77166 RepID=A0AAR5Q3H9_DENPD
IKIWNIGQQRCIQTILLHTEAVWALLATENFTYLISGGRDKKVIMTDLKNVQNSVLVCTEEAPVLKMCFTADQQGIWVSTSDSTVRCWKLPSEKHFSDDIPLSRQPISVIPGDASTVKATILNDKRHILTKDFNGNVFLYDVLRAIKVESLGPVNYQNEINARNSGKLLYVPNWFTTDLKTGMLTIHLGQDEVDCFAAWVSAKDAGIDHPEPDHKVNYGKLLLHALFEHYRGLQPDQESRLHFTVPKYIPLILSEIGGRTLYRVLITK